MALSNPPTSPALRSFHSVYAELVGFLSRRTGNVEDARELVHDTWLRLAERELGHGAMSESAPATAPTDPRAYLFTVAQNVAIDFMRRGQWMREFVRESELASAPSAHSPDVADAVMYRQALDAVVDTLSALPARTREAFLAHRLGDEGQTAIAARLGVSLNTVERDVMLATSRIEAALHRWRGQTARPRQQAGRRRSLGALLGIAGCGMVGWAAWQHGARPQLQWQLALESPRGQLRRQSLPDGSSVMLDAMSAVQMRYYADRREVALLRGAAFFDVQRDASRPFVVQALDTRITVLGTRFGVEIEAGSVIVQVESGRVSVQSAGMSKPEVLEPGQALRQGAGGLHRRESVPDGAASSWRHGEIHLDATPLRDAIARLARHVPVEMEVDARAGDLPVSGVVRLASSREWVLALPKALPVRIETHPGQRLSITRR